VVSLSSPRSLQAAVAIVAEQLAAVDLACSRFRADSELSRANERAGETVTAGPLLVAAVKLAIRAAELTGGLVDPTIGRALERAGWDRDWELMDLDGTAPRPDSGPRLVARRRAEWRRIELSPATLRVPRGVKLDLGATAKALAADLACRAVHEQHGGGVLVALGGDLATLGEPPVSGWQVHVTDDHRAGPSAPGQRVTIQAGGLASSSTSVRRWERGGQRMHHIIDPATGAPAETRWRTVSVAAADCVDANIASTAALLREADAPGWLRGLGLPARLVDRDGNVITTAGWPADPGQGAAP
jgi:thiamine biosynthesis lipoprotein